jgi:creatinine amidohydrolase
MQERAGVSVGHFYPWKVMSGWGPELFGGDWKAVFGHGAEPNTSVMLYLMPENVDMRYAVAGSLDPLGGRPMAGSRYVDIDGVQSQVYIDLRRVNASSVTGGNPRLRPDPELGRIFVERCAKALVDFVAWFRTQDLRAGMFP